MSNSEDMNRLHEEFNNNGFAIIKDFLTESEIDDLLKQCSNIVQDMTIPAHCSVFTTADNESRDEYFLKSGDNISFFFEEGAVDKEGNLVVEKEKALNKIGHALHWLNPSFKRVTFSDRIKNIMKSFQYKDPVVVQSMIIFKHPEIGGEVKPHQDSTFLYTEPPSAVGIWLPLVDVTKENGCLWFIPGSHKGKIYQRFVRNPAGKPLLILEGEMPHFDESSYVPALVNKGDCVIIHGSVIHKSGKNLSDKSRPVYTFHITEQKNTTYSKDNWLQPSTALPFPSIFSEKN